MSRTAKARCATAAGVMPVPAVVVLTATTAPSAIGATSATSSTTTEQIRFLANHQLADGAILGSGNSINPSSPTSQRSGWPEPTTRPATAWSTNGCSGTWAISTPSMPTASGTPSHRRQPDPGAGQRQYPHVRGGRQPRRLPGTDGRPAARRPDGRRGRRKYAPLWGGNWYDDEAGWFILAATATNP